MGIASSDFLQTAHELSLTLQPFVVVTLTGTRGHAPQDPGAKVIVTKEGLFWGTVGGGKVEAKVIAHAQSLLQRDAAAPAIEFVTWNLQRDVGMTCGGEVSYLFELYRTTSWNIAVFGAGHVAQALVQALLPLRCRVTCVDPREEWLAKLPKHKKLETRLTSDMPGLVARFSKDTFFVVMTQGHATDVPLLKEIFKNFGDAPYIGCMGSAIKAKKMRIELAAAEIPTAQLERFHSPIGYPIGENDPPEIAASVVAQLLEVRDRWRENHFKDASTAPNTVNTAPPIRR